MFESSFAKSVIQKINIDAADDIELYLKRDDLLHPKVSGNKFRKLKYNIAFAKAHKKTTLLTFGGAYSNHIAATAAAGAFTGFKTIGIIRGDELGEDVAQTLSQNDTLRIAVEEHGMELRFVSRSAYRKKDDPAYLVSLQEEFPDALIIPEGGTNELAIRGTAEIVDEASHKCNYLCCAVGTGGTIAGLIEGSMPHQKVVGFPALKGDFLKAEIEKWTTKSNFELVDGYHFGGYAKVSDALISFINRFYSAHQVLLDPVYTGKMMYGVMDLIDRGYFPPKSRIFAVHSGGLQGIPAMNKARAAKGLSTIAV